MPLLYPKKVYVCARAVYIHVHDKVSARATVVLLSNGVTISVFALSPR